MSIASDFRNFSSKMSCLFTVYSLSSLLESDDESEELEKSEEPLSPLEESSDRFLFLLVPPFA